MTSKPPWEVVDDKDVEESKISPLDLTLGPLAKKAQYNGYWHDIQTNGEGKHFIYIDSNYIYIRFFESLKKEVIQDPHDGRGVKSGDNGYVMNHRNEITFDVVKGVSKFHYYTRLAKPRKFATREDAMDYINELGAVEGTTDHQPYYSLTRADGCAFQSIGFYSVK